MTGQKISAIVVGYRRGHGSSCRARARAARPRCARGWRSCFGHRARARAPPRASMGATC